MHSLPHPPRGAVLPAPARLGAWLLLALAVLLAHLLLLQALPGEPVRPEGAAAPLQLRWLVADAAPPTRPTELPPPAPAVAPAQTRATPVRPRLQAKAAAPHGTPSAASAGTASGTGGVTPASAKTAPWPVYATRLPEPVRLHYLLQRGARDGRAQLQWQRTEEGYLLRLDTEWPGQPLAGAASRGQVDAYGVAPLRHVQLRRERELRAVNFQREAGLITFSGPQRIYALLPGAQDRLSWLIQLPAVVAADPARAQPGSEVLLFVAGPSGDAEPWRFVVEGPEQLRLPAGEVAGAVHLRREPTRPYDTRVQVWLDPARSYLPVRLRYTTVPGEDSLLMELADVQGGGVRPPSSP